MQPSRLPSALMLVLLAGSLAACLGSPPNASPVPKAPLPAAAQLLPASLDISQANQQEGSDPLNLTAEQRRQFTAISQEAQRNDRSSELQRLLLAPEIDTARLRSQLTQSESDIAQAVSMQLRLREILTPQQRQTLIQNYQQASASSESGPTESQLRSMQQELGLNAEQMRLFTAMAEASKRHTEANDQQLRQAQITLVQTGNGEPFRQALLASNRSMPLDELVAYFSSLTQAQRQKLFSESSGSSSGS